MNIISLIALIGQFLLSALQVAFWTTGTVKNWIDIQARVKEVRRGRRRKAKRFRK